MKRLIGLLLLTCSTHAAWSGELCDAECLITIEFTDAGYIEAHQALTFTFGDGGLVDTVAAVIAKADGETLVLNAGERLDFGAGGRLELGNGGNLEFVHVEFNNASTFQLESTGGPAVINIAAGSSLVLNGGTHLTISSPLNLMSTTTGNSASITLQGGTLSISGTGCVTGCEVVSSGSATLIASPTPGSLLTFDNNGGTSTGTLIAGNFGVVEGFVSLVTNNGKNNNSSATNSPTGKSSSGSSSFDFLILGFTLGLLVVGRCRRLIPSRG